MVHRLEHPLAKIFSHELSDFFENDSEEDLTEDSHCIYEDDPIQMCHDVYEYQQMQASDNVNMTVDSDDVSTVEDAVHPTCESGWDIEQDEELAADIALAAAVHADDIVTLESPRSQSNHGDDDESHLPEDEVLLAATGLFGDPTADCERDDFQDTVPTCDDVSRFGIRGKTSLLPVDVCDLLKSQRMSIDEVKPQEVDDPAVHIELSTFDFVPDLVMCLLLSLFPDGRQLHRMLSQEWMRDWDGWKEWDKPKRNQGSIELDDDSFAEELVKRILVISMDQAVINYPSDEVRKKDLFMSDHLEVRHGEGAGNNCLTDSLLQGLVHNKVIVQSETNCKDWEWRRKVCDEVRRHLCSHDDVRFRPKQRDDRSAIRNVSQDAHNRAYLEHHRHAVPIVTYLISNYGVRNLDLSCGFSVTVYSRFDGDIIYPENDSLVIHRSAEANRPAIPLLLYNNAGNGTTGYHYDPVLPVQRRVKQRQAFNNASSNDKPMVSNTSVVSNRNSEHSMRPKSKAVPKPNKATFLCVENPFTMKCTSTKCDGDCEETIRKENALENTQPISNEDEEIAEPILEQYEEYNGFYILNCKEFGTSPGKFREKLDDALHTLSTLFRRHPTLPADPANPEEYMKEACDDSVGLLLPRKHCAFKHCMWNGSDDMALIEHIHENHHDALRPAINAFHALKSVHGKDSEAFVELSIYNEGIATAIRQGAPLASYSIDRMCMLQYNTHMKHEDTGALVCFVCARRFPRVHGAKHNPIQFKPSLQPTTPNVVNDGSTNRKKSKDDIMFLNGFNKQKTEKMFGLKSYCEKYGKMNEDVTLSMEHAEFDDWHVFIPFQGERVKVLCCPEDIKCCSKNNPSQRHATNESCLDCMAPMCNECSECVFASEPSLPPAGLSDDLMICYAPSVLYTHNVSVMEMICASVCITSMISFTLGKKYRGSRSLDQTHNTNKHRMAARGNATSFPLSWEDLFKQLQDGEEMAKLGQQVSLPRTGSDLASIVSVLLKTAAGDDTERDVARLIHQCVVRRDIVVKMIEIMKERGHKAYKHVDMEQVKNNANALPENAVPPEVIKFLSLDDLQDKIQMQKGATPVPIARDLQEVSDHFKV